MSSNGWKYASEERLARYNQDIVRLAADDFDRRIKTRRGRFLLWLLRKTT